MTNTNQISVLSIVSDEFEATCKLPIYNIDIVKKCSIADHTIYEYDTLFPNKNTYIGTAKENIQHALIYTYSKYIEKLIK